MNVADIDDLVDDIKRAKKNKPIVFLGAGVSVSGGVPLAGDIAKKIEADYSHKPNVKKLEKEKRDYISLMKCLSPSERKECLGYYIKRAKINVAHLYLANLLKEGYVDYVLTVNFDNLMLRASALYNIFPPTYDVAILKDLTTSSFSEKSVTYLHGQHHGLWLLNTEDEMSKVNEVVPSIFNKIADGRTWIVLGYSGADGIFDHIRKLGRFDNNLYWVGYKEEAPLGKVESFLNEKNNGTHYIPGYDADSFMLKLNKELGLAEPEILDKPFSCLKKMLDNVVDIEDAGHLKSVKERHEGNKRQIDEAIEIYEEGREVKIDKEELKRDKLKKELIDIIIADKYDEAQGKRIEEIEEEIKQNDYVSLNDILSGCYNNWGNALMGLAKMKEGEERESLYQESFKKYEKATEIKEDFHEAYYNWGVALSELAKTKEGEERERLYEESCKKYEKATEIKGDDHEAYYNWGVALSELAKTKEGEERERLYEESCKKYEKALEIKEDKHEAYYNWGNALSDLAEMKEGEERESLYEESCDKYEKATKKKTDYHEAYNNWGVALSELAKTKEGEERERLYEESFKKYEKALEIKEDKHEAYNNWGVALSELAKTKEGEEREQYLELAESKYKLGLEYGGKVYNLACVYALMQKQEEAFFYLEKSLSKREISLDHVLKDKDWTEYLENLCFQEIIKIYS